MKSVLNVLLIVIRPTQKFQRMYVIYVVTTTKFETDTFFQRRQQNDLTALVTAATN